MMLEYAISRLDVTGCHLTEYSIKILGEHGYSFTTSAEREVARDIKEKLDCVEDFEAETKQEETSDTSDIAKGYKLPERRVIIIRNEGSRSHVVLFKPSLIGKKSQSIHKLTYDSIMKCNVDIRRDLYTNGGLSGGTTNVSCN